jgi:DNA-binding PadR family transcriptional regulator
MSRSELSPFSYVVLVLIGRDGAGAHDLVRMARQGRVYASAAESHYYAEPKRLAKLGYLTAEKQPGQTHPRTHYRLTGKAYDALRAWAREPVTFPGIPTQPIVRLLAADLVGIEPVLESLQALRTDITDLIARIDVAEAVASTLPHRVRVLLLNHRLARNVLQAHLDWLDAIERELAPARPARDHTRRAEDGALMEPSGRNPSQPVANRGRSKAAKIGGSAARRNPRQPPKL